MAKHYLANRKPQRIVRIRQKVANLEYDGVSLDCMEMTYCGREIALRTLLDRRFEELGYTMLCSIETSLDEIRASYENAKTDAIGVIAHLAGSVGMDSRDVYQIATKIRPSRWREDYKKYLVDSKHAFEFQAWAFGTGAVLGYWSELRGLTLTELHVLCLQIELKQRDKKELRLLKPGALAD